MPKFWYQRKIISYLLLPFSFIYRLIINLRRLCYLYLPSSKFSVPIIVVGNITVGGAGKTPLVIYLVELLRRNGYTPGVISRGYGGNKKGAVIVTSESKAGEVGDEPLLIAHRLNCPVVVGNNRVAATKKLLEIYKCDVVISDDGLQHYALPRDIEIVVFDNELQFGNKFCLPAGPLREPLDRLKRSDFIIRNFNTGLSSELILREENLLQKERAHEYNMVLVPAALHNIQNPLLIRSPDYFQKKTIHAVAGIGNPKKFFKTLSQLQLGASIIEYPFPDHYQYCSYDFSFSGADEIIIMTEKDAVKCNSIASENFWYLEVNAKLATEFDRELLTKLIKVKATACLS